MKNNTLITDWTKGIKKMGETEREISNKLTPNKSQMNNALTYAREIYETVLFMSNSAMMAHEELIDFKIAQKLIDSQKNGIKESIKYLEVYLGIYEEK